MSYHSELAIQTGRRGWIATMLLLVWLRFGFVSNLPAQLGLLAQWEGITATDFTPPDSHGAAGPHGVIATVNLQISYRRFDGTTIWGSVELADFMAPAGNGKTGNSDPKVLFDPDSGRFFVAMQENLSSQSFVNLAVSKTSDPHTSSANDWFFYRVEMTQSDGVNLFGGDYTCMGLDSRGFYMTYNMFQLPVEAGTGVFRNSQILVFDKAALANGTVTVNRLNASGDTLQPVSVFGADTPGNVAYFVESGSVSVTLWALVDPLGTASLSSTLVTIPDNGGLSAVGAPQPGTVTLLDITSRAQGSAFWHGGSIWFCHTAGGSRAQVFYYRIAANNYPAGTPSLGESGSFDGGPGVWTFCPAIGGNARGDVCLVYSQSSASQNPTVMCTLRRAGDAVFAPAIPLKPSPYAYSGITGTNHVARWGDFAAVSTDPEDGSFWVVQEWVRSAGGDDWSTWWANVNPWGLNHVIYVDAAYGAGSPDGSASRPFPTVTVANQAALDGTVLRVASGWYPETLTFTKQLRIEARNGPVTIGP